VVSKDCRHDLVRGGIGVMAGKGASCKDGHEQRSEEGEEGKKKHGGKGSADFVGTTASTEGKDGKWNLKQCSWSSRLKGSG